MSDGWLWMTAEALGHGIGRGEIDARELTEVYLSAIESHPEGTGIYARLTPERARAEAAAAADRAAAGLRRGPLDGVPIAWKDLFDTAGIATEAGSALLAGRVPERDAPVVAAATRAGLVCLGKTHMTELAFSGLGLNPVTATPPNINDPDLAPGGSSSGSAAAIAFGLAAAAIGSDTAGSVRIPAAWNDLVGLKTTHGLLPLDGVVPLRPAFDTVGPLARSVADASLLLAALGGPTIDLAGARIGGTSLLVLDDPDALPTREEPAEAFEAAVAWLGAAGANITRARLPAVAEALRLWPAVAAPEAYGVWRDIIEARPELMFDRVLARFRSGKDILAADYIIALRALDAARAAWREATAAFDAVLLPTTANLPPNVERLFAEPDYFIAENLLALRNPGLANLLGLPAVTLPGGTPSCGLMLFGRPRGEAALLRLAAGVERVLAD